MYTKVCTRPDVAYVVVVVRKFMSDSEMKHWTIVKCIQVISGVLLNLVCVLVLSNPCYMVTHMLICQVILILVSLLSYLMTFAGGCFLSI